MGIKERLGAIKERVKRKFSGSETRNGNGGNGESRTMTREEVRDREYSPPKKAKTTTTTWKPSKPVPKEKPKSGIRGYLERRAKEEREKKERRDKRKSELEIIASKAYTKGVEDYYRHRGRSEGYQAAKMRNTRTAIPILGEPGKRQKQIAANVKSSPFLKDIVDVKGFLGTPVRAKSNKRRQSTIKVVIEKGGKVKRSTRKKRKRKKDSVWDFVMG